MIGNKDAAANIAARKWEGRGKSMRAVGLKESVRRRNASSSGRPRFSLPSQNAAPTGYGVT